MNAASTVERRKGPVAEAAGPLFTMSRAASSPLICIAAVGYLQQPPAQQAQSHCSQEPPQQPSAQQAQFWQQSQPHPQPLDVVAAWARPRDERPRVKRAIAMKRFMFRLLRRVAGLMDNWD